jgi:hypothetical protein
MLSGFCVPIDSKRRRMKEGVLGYTTVGRVKINLMNEAEAADALYFIESQGGRVELGKLREEYEKPRVLSCKHYLERRGLVATTIDNTDDKWYVAMTEAGRELLANSKISAGMKMLFD